MIARELVGTAQVQDGGELRCYRHDRDYFVFAGNTELMSTRVFGSEEVLAELAIERRGKANAKRVLVGGLGMGYSLARTLALVGPDTKVDVAELVPEMVQWHRDWFAEFNGHPLDDPRTELVVADVIDVVKDRVSTYDVILLDVDNGPEALLRPGNQSLYSQRGLPRVRAALKSGGVLAIWSSAEHPRFERRLQRTGFDVTRKFVRARRDKGPRRVIWIAERLA